MSTSGVFHRIKKLGEGTYGSVYRATTIDSGHVIAFKRMFSSNEEEGMPATAIREIALLRELKHANVVQLRQVMFDLPKITLVFELCDYDLKQYIDSKNGACLDPDTEVRPILKQMLNGLSYLHSKSVVHRDLKPQNVFINIRPAYYNLSDGSGTYPTITAASAQQLARHASSVAAGTSATTGSSDAAAPATMLMTTCAALPVDVQKSGGNSGKAAIANTACAAVTAATAHSSTTSHMLGGGGGDGASTAPALPSPQAANATGSSVAASLPTLLSCVIVKLGDFGLARVENIPVKKYSHEAVTLWYRSPDVIMGSALYSMAVDMWSVGTIFFEMVTGKAFLAGRSEQEQLLRIFKLLGSPTRETWPSMLTYPNTLERLQRVQTLVAESKSSSASATAASTSKNANSTSGDVGGGVNTSRSSYNNNNNSSSSTAGGVDGVTRHEATTTAASVRSNSYNLPSEVWISEGNFNEVMTTSGFRAAVGESGVDLLRCCLQYEPQFRITAAQALRHPFLRHVQTHNIDAITQPMDALAQSLQYKGL